MNLTIRDALIKGIEAHKAGNIREADQFYTLILNSQPDHPDANHNMGVLAVGIGKVEEAIPFFSKAIKSNNKVEQFWISYIDALLRLNKNSDAQMQINSAIKLGINEHIFDKPLLLDTNISAFMKSLIKFIISLLLS